MSIYPQLIVNSVITGSIYALAAAGLALTYSVFGILNFAHGHIMMCGAYAFLYFYVILNLGSVHALLLSMAVMAVLANLILRLFIRPFLNYSPLLTLITTLALSTMLESVVSVLFGVNVKSLNRGAHPESWQLAGVFITPLQAAIVAGTFLIMSASAVIIHHTTAGRRIRAVFENPRASEALGINRRSLGSAVFTVACLVTACAGILIGMENSVYPTMGNSYTIKVFAAMILGGLGNIWGTILGSYALGFIENFAIGIEIGGYALPAGYKDAFSYCIILLVLLFSPGGLFGLRKRRV